MASSIAVHSPPASQRTHWYSTSMGAVPFQVPGSAVSVCPTWAVPATLGAVAVTGPRPPTMAVSAESAATEPAAFLAVTVAFSVAPTSSAVSV